MIYSIIILILSLLLFPVHSFYIINAAVVEQCATGTSLYLKKFDSNKMRCLNKPWRQVFINLQYHCINNSIVRKWTMQTNISGSSPWPRNISVLSNKGKIIYYSSKSTHDCEYDYKLFAMYIAYVE